MSIQPALSFSDEDKVGTIQPHDDALVMVDQGSGVEIMYHDLYKGLNLRPEDLIAYDSPLVSFDGRLLFREVRLDCRCKLV